MINRLVVNGCSYMFNYTGQTELATQLKINQAKNISIPGSCNSRIIRTTLQDSYYNDPTLYIVGLTFLTRYELPINVGDDAIEGKWTSITTRGTATNDNFDKHFSMNDLLGYNKLWNNATALGLLDLAVDLQFKLLSMIDSLVCRGHRVLVFNTAESVYSYFLSNSKFDLLRRTTNIIEGLEWRSIPWQFKQGASYPSNDKSVPADYRHVAPGEHRWLNEFLTNYIHEYKILQ